MGADGHITLVRVEAGEYLVSAVEGMAQFVVTEPVAVLWHWFHRVGRDRHTNLDIPSTYDRMDSNEMSEIVVLGNAGALSIVPQRVLAEAHDTKDAWASLLATGSVSYERDPAIPLHAMGFGYLKEHWDQITPGRWLVDAYWPSGTDGESYYRDQYHRPPGSKYPYATYASMGLVLGAKVKWEIWT